MWKITMFHGGKSRKIPSHPSPRHDGAVRDALRQRQRVAALPALPRRLRRLGRLVREVRGRLGLARKRAGFWGGFHGKSMEKPRKMVDFMGTSLENPRKNREFMGKSLETTQQLTFHGKIMGKPSRYMKNDGDYD